MITTVTQENAQRVRELVEAITHHAEEIANAPADARPQSLAAHKAHITMVMQELRRNHPQLAEVAPMRRRAGENYAAAVIALREACAAAAPTEQQVAAIEQAAREGTLPVPPVTDLTGDAEPVLEDLTVEDAGTTAAPTRRRRNR